MLLLLLHSFSKQLSLLSPQVVAKQKAELIVQLIGYPDWLVDDAELDKYYQGVSECDSGGIHGRSS